MVALNSGCPAFVMYRYMVRVLVYLLKKTIPPQNDIHVLNKSKKNVTHKWVKSVIKIRDFMEFLQILGPFLKQFSAMKIAAISGRELFSPESAGRQ